MATLLDQFAQGAAERLVGPTVCSLTLADHGFLRQIASNDPRAAACDQIETLEQDGPCIDAMKRLHSVYVEDIDALDRWATWRRAALENGFRSFVALPAYVTDDVTVAANVYSEALSTWSRAEIFSVDRYVQEIAAAVEASL
jgi:GAF domain